MNVLLSLVAVLVLILVAYLGTGVVSGHAFFGIVLPYLAIVVFLAGIIAKVVKWARAPVPFRIPTTCGQQKSLDWIPSSKYDNPHTTFGVLVRMALEVLLFRSLFRNVKSEVDQGKVTHIANKWLWGAALLFHYSFLVIFIRHLRFFTEPVPFFIHWAESLDGFFQVGVPFLFITDLVIVGAATFLFLRRVVSPQLRYISLAADYFPLFLILSIAVSGIVLRYFVKTDIVQVKAMALGWLSFSPVASADIHWLFYAHLFLVCTLFIYFPFSKLTHMAGVFMSPTRNLANNNRAVRHINPWNDPNIKPHSYEDYEDEFRERMVDAGVPVDKPLPDKDPDPAPAGDPAPAEEG